VNYFRAVARGDGAGIFRLGGFCLVRVMVRGYRDTIAGCVSNVYSLTATEHLTSTVDLCTGERGAAVCELRRQMWCHRCERVGLREVRRRFVGGF